MRASFEFLGQKLGGGGSDTGPPEPYPMQLPCWNTSKIKTNNSVTCKVAIRWLSASDWGSLADQWSLVPAVIRDKAMSRGRRLPKLTFYVSTW